MIATALAAPLGGALLSLSTTNLSLASTWNPPRLGFQIVKGGTYPGKHHFHPRFVGAVEVWKGL